MGQGCCYPKDAGTDMRDGTSKRSKKGKNQTEENTFKRQLDGPEFKVTRRDSLGQAAKDHTEKVLESHENLRRSLAGTEVNTNGVNSKDYEQNQMRDVYNDGTFAENSEVSKNRESADQAAQAYDELLSIPVQLEPKSTLGCVSFGAANRLTFDNPRGEANGDHPSGSIISIKDIQEISDKVPASPVSQMVPEQKDNYFQ